MTVSVIVYNVNTFSDRIHTDYMTALQYGDGHSSDRFTTVNSAIVRTDSHY
jgi:hypothetical protein